MSLGYKYTFSYDPLNYGARVILEDAERPDSHRRKVHVGDDIYYHSISGNAYITKRKCEPYDRFIGTNARIDTVG